ncbi:hypothetical protein MKEN_00798400 [Mycena kentingensis (nom. inval.)]|nr:hypothetical protein MKEN_00798400 [Mycena kentingensis (nom. inval.)]
MQVVVVVWVLSLFMTCFAAQTIHNQLPSDQLCTPAGECEACPSELINEPFCQPFGSRRLMHCANGTAPIPITHASDRRPPPPPPLLDDRKRDVTHSHEGETLAWASCGRIVAQERADFFEFVACNVLFAAVALFGVFTRARRMRLRQARQLAARIGLAR